MRASMPTMRLAKFVLTIALAVAVLWLFVRFFAAEMAAPGGRDQEPAGVLFAAPEGFAVERRGELTREQAAGELARMVEVAAAGPRLALRFTARGFELFWLVEQTGPDLRLTELASGPGGTRVETSWQGSREELDRRLAWAAEHGTFEVPGLAAGVGRNLYH